jgi:hypothetical protein
LEPFTLAIAQLAYEGEEGPELAYRKAGQQIDDRHVRLSDKFCDGLPFHREECVA